MNDKVFCVGGAGFIGSHVVDLLVEEGFNVIVLDNLSTGSTENINKKAAFYNVDIRDYDSLLEIFEEEQPDYVFHFAAQINLRDSIKFPVNDCENNIMGSINLIDISSRNFVRKFIFSSTGGAIYSAKNDFPWVETHVVEPTSPYGLSKLTVEKYLEMYRSLRDDKFYSFNYAALRYSNVYGPRQNSEGEAGVVSIFIDKINNNEDLVIFGDGYQVRDFVFVEDVAKANLSALKNDLYGIYNVSTDKGTSVNEIAEGLIKISGKESKIVYKDKIPGELYRSVLCSDKIGKIWSFSVGLKEGLRRTFDSVKDIGGYEDS